MLRGLNVDLNIFQKIVVMILILFIPIMALYYYSTEKSVNVVRDELIKSSMNKMELFIFQLENSIEKFELVSAPLLVDTNVLEYLHSHSLSDYSMLKTRQFIHEKLSLASLSSNLQNNVTVYFPTKNEAISSATFYQLDGKLPIGENALGWRYGNHPDAGVGFVRYFVDTGAAIENPEVAQVIMAISLGEWEFEKQLDTYKSGNDGDPFFYKEGEAIIRNGTADETRMEQALEALRASSPPNGSGHLIRPLSGQNYLISYRYSGVLDCYLVDYMPLDRMTAPITEQRMLFYLTSVLMIFTGIAAAFTLYRNVQLPIVQLVRGVQRIKRGEYSYRIHKKKGNEFAFLMQNFNEMAERIEDLIEHELKSRIQARDATLKQLQAQIHPHFLYNSLGFIINMTKLKKEKAVIDMSYNLAEYYRYATRMENQGVTLKEELNFVMTYLEIHRMRTDTLLYTVELPADYAQLTIPRFLIQPAVENALVHGVAIEERPGRIAIRVYMREQRLHISIEDNGRGMTDDGIAKLRAELETPAEDYTGCGLWNVYQRMVRHFGAHSRLDIHQSPKGGLQVVLSWIMESGDAHV